MRLCEYDYTVKEFSLCILANFVHVRVELWNMATSVIEERKHVIENHVFILNSLEFSIFGST